MDESLTRDHTLSAHLAQFLILPECVSNLTVTAEDTEGRIYPLTVEFVGTVTGPPAGNQLVVRLPDSVVGAPRDLFVTVQLRTATTNRAFIKIAAP